MVLVWAWEGFWYWGVETGAVFKKFCNKKKTYPNFEFYCQRVGIGLENEEIWSPLRVAQQVAFVCCGVETGGLFWCVLG